MPLKPSDAFVGVIELFAILLPGTLLTVALIVAINSPLPTPLDHLLATTGAQWVAFVFCAYALGHFVFLIASRFDELLYERYRLGREAKWALIAAEEASDDARPRRRRGVRWDNKAFDLVTELRCRQFAGVAADRLPMGNFAWARAMLMLRAAPALAEVQRYEADSKFFRSLVIVLPLAALLLALRIEPLPLAFGLIAGSLGLAWLSWLRYAERRHKSTQWAFYYVLVLCRGEAAP